MDNEHDPSGVVYRKKSSCVLNTYRSTVNTVSLSPIQMIPPEVWELVFENLQDSRDLLSASYAAHSWHDILHPTKKTWLFVQVFPLLLEYFSKPDVFTCRLVCKKWCYAVDYFLQNNSFHRSVSSDPRAQMLEKLTNQYKTDNRIYPIDHLLRTLDLRYNPIKRLKDLVMSSSISPDNATIVGRSAIIAQERKNSRININQNSSIQFLQQFGHQIQFLRINLDTLSYFFNVIQYLPNLKKLDIVYLNPSLTREQLNQQISNLTTTRPISEIKAVLPKNLETLRIYMMRDDQYAFPQLLISLFVEQVESLKITAAIPPPLQQVPSRLVDLYIVIRENRHWDFFKCLVKCQIRRLLLNINGNHVNVKPMQVVLSNFKNSLRNLELHFTDEVREMKYNLTHYLFFAKERLRLPNLLRLTFKDNLPPSLNFISGLNSIQYLHIFTGRHAKGETRKAFYAARQGIKNGEEELDLLNIFFGILLGAEEQIDWKNALKYLGRNVNSLYNSNIWKIFPKLRVLTVMFMVRVNNTEGLNCHQETKEYELRRDIYEKLQESN